MFNGLIPAAALLFAGAAAQATERVRQAGPAARGGLSISDSTPIPFRPL